MSAIANSKSYDVIIVGGGPGGYVAALYAAKKGLNTALVESDKLGGTCLNRGCIPTKQLLRESQVLQTIGQSQSSCILEEVSFRLNRAAVYRQVFESVETLRGGVEGLLASAGVDVIQGQGSFLDKHHIQVNHKTQVQVLSSDHIVIATGSRPIPFPGLDAMPEGVIFSDRILEEEAPPMERLIIIGAGVIGIELATVFSRFGTKVQVLELCDQILPTLSRTIADQLQARLEAQGIDIRLKTKVASLQKVIGCVRVACQLEDELEYLEADQVLVAIGRKPNLEGLNYQQAGLTLVKGGIEIDAMCRTSVEGIYAIGDVTSQSLQLAHVASAQGMRAIDTILGLGPHEGPRPVPSCIYTDPEVAVVGMDEAACLKAGLDVASYSFPMLANSMSIIARQTDGFVTLIAEKESHRLVGAQLFCDRATDMIAELALAITAGLTLDEVSRTIHPHPSYCESIAEAAGLPLGHTIHING